MMTVAEFLCRPPMVRRVTEVGVDAKDTPGSGN